MGSITINIRQITLLQINRQQMNILLDMLKSSRTVISTPRRNHYKSEDVGNELVNVNVQNIPYGPFFPNLKKLTITSQVNLGRKTKVFDKTSILYYVLFC